MTDEPQAREPQAQGMGAANAARLEYAIIGLGVLALVLIFQPLSLTLFGIGCALVVLAGLLNNLLPLCEPQTSLRAVAKVALIVAAIFVVVVGLAMLAAHYYGVFFVGRP
jgi:hypothetical protein